MFCNNLPHIISVTLFPWVGERDRGRGSGMGGGKGRGEKKMGEGNERERGGEGGQGEEGFPKSLTFLAEHNRCT